MTSLRFFPPATAHFVGIGGVGMAGLAHLLHCMGWQVSGCDSQASSYTKWLETNGILVEIGHDPRHIANTAPQLVIRTPAVPDSAPELLDAQARHIPIVSRGDVLAAFSDLFSLVAVCGSHGKTTTSAFLATILRDSLQNSAWCIGGLSPVLGALSHLPDSALPFLRQPRCPFAKNNDAKHPILVAEADESDGTLAEYRPRLTVLTNVDLDHVDRFPDAEAFENVFRSCIRRTRGQLVFCADHPRAAAIASQLRPNDARSFGFSRQAQYRIFAVSLRDDSSTYSLALPDGTALTATLPVPGKHNLLNAAAAIAAAAEFGVPPETSARILSREACLPNRRFQIIGKSQGFRVISDYAHHPDEIRVLIETARTLPHKRIVGIFQPHRPSRTRTFRAAFPDAFIGLDELILCPVFSASEPDIPGGSTEDLYAEFRARKDISLHVRLALSLRDAVSAVRNMLANGDLILVIGAGDVDTIAPEIAALPPPERTTAPQKVLSAYGTPAPVPFFSEVEDEKALLELARDASRQGLPLLPVGCATNLLVADTGCNFPLVRLARSEFFSFIIPDNLPETDFVSLEVGAATPGAALLTYCQSFGLTGLEFMASIPGCIGGWLAMNAGTRAGSFCDVVTDVRALDADLVFRRTPIATLAPAYRHTPGLASRIAVSCRIRLRKSTPDAVRAAIAAAKEKRFDFSGLRTCGSVFKNPPGQFAGKLIEESGLKGFRIGGAFVSPRHANIIAADSSATASDILALVRLIQKNVLDKAGVELTPEIRILHGDQLPS